MITQEITPEKAPHVRLRITLFVLTLVCTLAATGLGVWVAVSVPLDTTIWMSLRRRGGTGTGSLVEVGMWVLVFIPIALTVFALWIGRGSKQNWETKKTRRGNIASLIILGAGGVIAQYFFATDFLAAGL